jgi:hypothetical protein
MEKRLIVKLYHPEKILKNDFKIDTMKVKYEWKQ